MNKNFVTSKKLFQVQNRGVITRLELLYYTKSMLTAMINNVYIIIGLVNRAKYIFVNIVLNDDSMFNL